MTFPPDGAARSLCLAAEAMTLAVKCQWSSLVSGYAG
jgi:hypothetical protein